MPRVPENHRPPRRFATDRGPSFSPEQISEAVDQLLTLEFSAYAGQLDESQSLLQAHREQLTQVITDCLQANSPEEIGAILATSRIEPEHVFAIIADLKQGGAVPPDEEKDLAKAIFEVINPPLPEAKKRGPWGRRLIQATRMAIIGLAAGMAFSGPFNPKAMKQKAHMTKKLEKDQPSDRPVWARKVPKNPIRIDSDESILAQFREYRPLLAQFLRNRIEENIRDEFDMKDPDEARLADLLRGFDVNKYLKHFQEVFENNEKALVHMLAGPFPYLYPRNLKLASGKALIDHPVVILSKRITTAEELEKTLIHELNHNLGQIFPGRDQMVMTEGATEYLAQEMVEGGGEPAYPRLTYRAEILDVMDRAGFRTGYTDDPDEYAAHVTSELKGKFEPEQEIQSPPDTEESDGSAEPDENMSQADDVPEPDENMSQADDVPEPDENMSQADDVPEPDENMSQADDELNGNHFLNAEERADRYVSLLRNTIGPEAFAERFRTALERLESSPPHARFMLVFLASCLHENITDRSLAKKMIARHIAPFTHDFSPELKTHAEILEEAVRSGHLEGLPKIFSRLNEPLTDQEREDYKALSEDGPPILGLYRVTWRDLIPIAEAYAKEIQKYLDQEMDYPLPGTKKKMMQEALNLADLLLLMLALGFPRYKRRTKKLKAENKRNAARLTGNPNAEAPLAYPEEWKQKYKLPEGIREAELHHLDVAGHLIDRSTRSRFSETIAVLCSAVALYGIGLMTSDGLEAYLGVPAAVAILLRRYTAREYSRQLGIRDKIDTLLKPEEKKAEAAGKKEQEEKPKAKKIPAPSVKTDLEVREELGEIPLDSMSAEGIFIVTTRDKNGTERVRLAPGPFYSGMIPEKYFHINEYEVTDVSMRHTVHGAPTKELPEGEVMAKGHTAISFKEMATGKTVTLVMPHHDGSTFYGDLAPFTKPSGLITGKPDEKIPFMLYPWSRIRKPSEIKKLMDKLFELRKPGEGRFETLEAETGKIRELIRAMLPDELKLQGPGSGFYPQISGAHPDKTDLLRHFQRLDFRKLFYDRIEGRRATAQPKLENGQRAHHRLASPEGEFRAHRAYSPGDDPRHVDWNASARTDGLVVKNFETVLSSTKKNTLYVALTSLLDKKYLAELADTLLTLAERGHSALKRIVLAGKQADGSTIMNEIDLSTRKITPQNAAEIFEAIGRRAGSLMLGDVEMAGISFASGNKAGRVTSIKDSFNPERDFFKNAQTGRLFKRLNAENCFELTRVDMKPASLDLLPPHARQGGMFIGFEEPGKKKLIAAELKKELSGALRRIMEL